MITYSVLIAAIIAFIWGAILGSALTIRLMMWRLKHSVQPRIVRIYRRDRP
jgi:uncharacterized protein YneF (UPF0154 family)